MMDRESDVTLPSEPVAALIRAGVAVVLEAPPEWVAELNEAVLRGVGMDEIAGDAKLLEIALQINMGNFLHWASRNLEVPGQRVGVADSGEADEFVREVVRRGLDAGALDSFRTAQNAAWDRWMSVCFELTDDLVLLRELLKVTADSIATFIDDTVHALAEQVNLARAELAGDTHARRRVALTLLLDGAPISPERAQSQLRYRLDGAHTALVLSGDTASADDLESICALIAENSGASNPLVMRSGGSELWAWLPVSAVDIGRVLDGHADVRIAMGSAALGREGFRRSHFEALSVQRLAARHGLTRRVARYDDLRLVALLGDDAAATDAFIASTLGDLATSDDDLVRDCVRAWFASSCNANQAATRLYTHRNTVVRRLARADALLPVPLRDNAVHIAVALELLDQRG